MLDFVLFLCFVMIYRGYLILYLCTKGLNFLQSFVSYSQKNKKMKKQSSIIVLTYSARMNIKTSSQKVITWKTSGLFKSTVKPCATIFSPNILLRQDTNERKVGKRQTLTVRNNREKKDRFLVPTNFCFAMSTVNKRT